MKIRAEISGQSFVAELDFSTQEERSIAEGEVSIKLQIDVFHKAFSEWLFYANDARARLKGQDENHG